MLRISTIPAISAFGVLYAKGGEPAASGAPATPPATPPATGAATTGTEVATSGDGKAPAGAKRLAPQIGSQASIGGKKFAVKSQVTRNVFPQKEGEIAYLKITGPIYQGEELKNSRNAGPKMEPARLAEVVNLETGELGLKIMNKVLEGRLFESFPAIKGNTVDNHGKEVVGEDGKPVAGTIPGYVGKSLAIEMVAGPAGARYKGFNIWEIEEVTE